MVRDAVSENRIAAIDAEVLDLRARVENAKGRRTEVYTRIVGYYRNVDNWNAGKRAEFGMRVTFKAAGL